MAKENTNKIMQSNYRIDDMRMFYRCLSFGKKIARRKTIRHAMDRWFKAKWKKYIKEVMDDEINYQP